MAMSVDEVVDIGMCLDIFLRIEHQELLVLSHIRRFLPIGTLHAGMFCPSLSEPHRPARMEHGEQVLTGSVMEHTADELEFLVRITQTVAMSHEEHLTIDLGGERLFMENHAAFLFQIAIHPDVVVASEVMHLYAHIGQFRDLSQETCISFGYGIFPFVPEIEHVAKQIHGCRLVFNIVKEPHESSFLHPLMRDSPRS